MDKNKSFEEFINGFDFVSFINKYKDADPDSVAFTLKKEYGGYYPFLAEQLKLLRKSVTKLPRLAENHCLYTSKSFEQSSSEAMAYYKAQLFTGKDMLDLSGGLGVDDLAFSGSFEKVISVDTNSELNIIARYNFAKLKKNNIERIDADAYEFIKREREYDLVYLDADRRVKTKDLGKFKLLEDTEPSIMEIKSRLFELTGTILLKLSPLADLTYLIKKLENISAIYVVSINNEIKEVLTVLSKNYEGKNPVIKAVDISNGNVTEYSAVWKYEAANEIFDVNSGAEYFYEPAAVLVKSALAKKYAHEKELKAISENCLYFAGNDKITGFFGRSFEIVYSAVFSKSVVSQYLVKNNIRKANVAKRNFPVDTGEIKKLFQISDGGDEYLFFAQNDKREKLFFHCRKVT